MAQRKTKKTTKPIVKKTTSKAANKPVFRTGTWVTIAAFLVIVALAYFINRNAEATTQAEITPTQEAKFAFDSTALIQSIEVKPAEGQTVKLERNTDNVWALTQPEAAAADTGLAEAAASQISALKIIEEISGDPSIFGFDQPAYIITVTFEDGASHTLEIGDNTPTNSGYYARLDKKDMMILSLSGIDSLTNLAKFPPYLHTPTPTATATPIPSETPVPTVEATATP